MIPTKHRVEHARPLDLMRSLTIDLAIRIGLLVLLAYWSLKVIGPFVTILLWSGILTVALYPVFSWLARVIGSKTLAAATITVLSLMIVLGPVTWLGFAMVGGIELLAKGIDTGQLAIPMPPDAVKSWPLIGEKIYQLWSQAATNTEALLLQAAPYMKTVGGKLLSISQGVAVGLLEFVGSIIIAGFLYSPGPRILDFMRTVLRRILGHESHEAHWRHDPQCGSRRGGNRAPSGPACRNRFCRRRNSGTRSFYFPCPSIRYRSDRASDIDHPDDCLELDKNGAVKRSYVHRLYDSGEPRRQHSETSDHGTWFVDADAGHPGRCHRWHDSLWHKRAFCRTYRSGSALGLDPGVGD
jgi:hypothetical protein